MLQELEFIFQVVSLHPPLQGISTVAVCFPGVQLPPPGGLVHQNRNLLDWWLHLVQTGTGSPRGLWMLSRGRQSRGHCLVEPPGGVCWCSWVVGPVVPGPGSLEVLVVPAGCTSVVPGSTPVVPGCTPVDPRTLPAPSGYGSQLREAACASLSLWSEKRKTRNLTGMQPE